MPTSKTMTQKARKLRKSSTDAEHLLWYHLRNRRLFKYKFKRQQPVGKFIVDFICHHKKLIIELDGGQHQQNQSYDEKRTEYLKTQGYNVIRFWNTEVLSQTEAILQILLDILS